MGDFRELKADFSGLVTTPGALVRAEASCIRAHNVTFDAPGVIRKRRGFERLSVTGGSASKVFSSPVLDDLMLVHRGTGSQGTLLETADGTNSPDAVVMLNRTGSTPSTLTRDWDTGTRMSVALSGRNHYATADEGVARIESSLDTAVQRFAGMPRGLSLGGFQPGGLSVLTTGTALADGFGRSYRVTWHLRDADGVELGGAPTGRACVRNITNVFGYTGASRGVACKIQIPLELSSFTTAPTTAFFWRLWGTRTFDTSLSNGDDEMYLIAERFLTAGEITAGGVAYVDDTPDAFLIRQPTLHTNVVNWPSGESGAVQGILNESAPPPVADCLAQWADVMWYGNIAYRARVVLQMIAVPTAGDTVSLSWVDGGAGTTFTFSGAPAAATDVQLYAGLASAALNIEACCMALCEAINGVEYTRGGGLHAYYVSVGGQLGGRIYIESRMTGVASIMTVGVSRATAWVAGDVSDDAQTNGLAFSKPFRADAVPPANALVAGPASVSILALQPYRDRLLVFTDAGIYQVLGRSYADFTVLPFDLTYRLLARESVTVCDDRVYAWCYEGIIEIDDGGVRVVSVPIEQTITEALLSAKNTGVGLDDGYAAFSRLVWAASYRSKHRVMFFYPQKYDVAALGGCAYWLCFDTRTRAWSTNGFSATFGDYIDNRSCGAVRFSDDNLVCGNWSSGGDTRLLQERARYDATDYIDTTSEGDDVGIESEVGWQFAMPAADGAAHWQQMTLHWDQPPWGASWTATPGSLTVNWYPDNEAAFSQATLAPTSGAPLLRLETPRDARRGNRLRLLLQHSGNSYFGLIGMTMAARVGSRFASRGPAGAI